MGIRKITRFYNVLVIGLIILVINQCPLNREEAIPLHLSFDEDRWSTKSTSQVNRILEAEPLSLSTLTTSSKLLTHSKEHANVWNDERKPAEVPRILHFVILGDAPHEHMIKFVEFNTKVAIEHGFEVMLWRDEDAEKLVQRHEKHFNGLSQSWDYIKLDRSRANYARRADFIRVIIMYAMGGVYLDADFIMCDGVDFMVDTPGTVSFPFKTEIPASRELSNAIMAAPSHHRLFELALETFIMEGPKIGSKPILHAVGPSMIAKITDQYFKEIGVELASMYDGYSPFSAQPVEGVIVVTSDYWKARVADVRFAPYPASKGLYHVAFRSWFPEKKLREKKMKVLCFDNAELISPFLDNFCKVDKRTRAVLYSNLKKCAWTAAAID